MKNPLIAAVLIAFAAGCASAPPPDSKTAPKPAATPAAPAPTDWSRIDATTDGSQILAWKTIARHCDAWYKGSRQVVDLRFNPDGHAEDGEGHRMKMRAADWKGIVQATRQPGAAVEAFASLSEVYSSGDPRFPQDKFGLKARYRYGVTAVSDDVLRFSLIEKLDGGM